MVEIKFRSSEKGFSKQEMVWKERKCKKNGAWNSGYGGRGRRKK